VIAVKASKLKQSPSSNNQEK